MSRQWVEKISSKGKFHLPGEGSQWVLQGCRGRFRKVWVKAYCWLPFEEGCWGNAGLLHHWRSTGGLRRGEPVHVSAEVELGLYFREISESCWGSKTSSSEETSGHAFRGRHRRIKIIHHHIHDRFWMTTTSKWDSHIFNWMRSLIVCRVTLFNARRVGEPSRLTLSEWDDAKNEVWIDPQMVESVEDPLDKCLLHTFKLAYQSGKGSRKLVPVLIPKDTVQPIEALVENRGEAGVSPENIHTSLLIMCMDGPALKTSLRQWGSNCKNLSYLLLQYSATGHQHCMPSLMFPAATGMCFTDTWVTHQR